MRTITTLALVAAAFAAAPAAAIVNIAVTNPSFEATPSGTFSDCSSGCLFTFGPNGDVPGWIRSPFSDTGLFRPAVPLRFNFVPDGITVAYSNAGSLSQTVSAVAKKGYTYTLTTMVGLRNDGFANPGTVSLTVGSNTVLATGVAPTVGNWSPFTATYTATAADDGQAITILLDAASPQGTWDMVSLTAVPEPETWAMMIVGFGMVGVVARRRKTAIVA